MNSKQVKLLRKTLSKIAGVNPAEAIYERLGDPVTKVVYPWAFEQKTGTIKLTDDCGRKTYQNLKKTWTPAATWSLLRQAVEAQ